MTCFRERTILDFPDLSLRICSNGGSLGDETPDDPVVPLVGTSLTGAVGMGEEDGCSSLPAQDGTFNPVDILELGAVVEGDCPEQPSEVTGPKLALKGVQSPDHGLCTPVRNLP